MIVPKNTNEKNLIQVHEMTDYGKGKREFDLKTYFLEYDSYSKIQRQAKTNKQLHSVNAYAY